MQTETGEIRRVEKIPKEELGKWSEIFYQGEIVEFKGVKMEIVKIKKLRKELVLRFAGGRRQ